MTPRTATAVVSLPGSFAASAQTTRSAANPTPADNGLHSRRPARASSAWPTIMDAATVIAAAAIAASNA